MLLSAFFLTFAGIVSIWAVGHPSETNVEVIPQQENTDQNSIEPPTQATESPKEALAEVNTLPQKPHKYASHWKKQLLYALVGLVGFLFVTLLNYRKLGPISYLLYAGVLVLLVILLVDKVIDLPFVPNRPGPRRWIQLLARPQIRLQPSEFCKIIYVLALAYYLRYRKNYRELLGLIGPFALTLLAVMLILVEPDLGTSLLMMPILFAMLFAAGAKVKHLLLIIMLAILSSPLLWTAMQDYQRMRISSVLLQNPKIFEYARKHPNFARVLVGRPEKLYEWRRKEGYHLLHSKYAISSGGMEGYGLAKGPYVQDPYYNLPENHNDFIFATIAHQFGFWGCAAILALYGLILTCGMEIAWRNTDPFGRLVAVGITAMFAVEVLVNISMTLGLMPITGLTLPFVSYGGSSLLRSYMALGLLNSIGSYRPFSVAKRPFEFGAESQ